MTPEENVGVRYDEDTFALLEHSVSALSRFKVGEANVCCLEGEVHSVHFQCVLFSTCDGFMRP